MVAALYIEKSCSGETAGLDALWKSRHAGKTRAGIAGELQ
jgi:hypothetical protein